MLIRWETIFKRALVTAWVIFLAQAVAPPVWGSTVAYSGSIQYARGNYIFDQTTGSMFMFNGLSFSSEGLNLSASIPVIFQSTPYVSYSGVGIIPSGGSEHTQVSGRKGKNQEVILPEPVDYEQFGIGDPTVSLGLRLLKESKLFPTVQLVVQAKLPLASIEKGFGTGEWDYSGGLSLSKALGKTFLFVDMYYWMLGDLPDLELKDTVSYSIAIGQPLSGGKYALLVSYSGSTNIISEVAPPSFLGFGFSYRIDAKKSLMLNASLGLTESVPDFSVSIGWNIGF